MKVYKETVKFIKTLALPKHQFIIDKFNNNFNEIQTIKEINIDFGDKSENEVIIEMLEIIQNSLVKLNGRNFAKLSVNKDYNILIDYKCYSGNLISYKALITKTVFEYNQIVNFAYSGNEQFAYDEGYLELLRDLPVSSITGYNHSEHLHKVKPAHLSLDEWFKYLFENRDKVSIREQIFQGVLVLTENTNKTPFLSRKGVLCLAEEFYNRIEKNTEIIEVDGEKIHALNELYISDDINKRFMDVIIRCIGLSSIYAIKRYADLYLCDHISYDKLINDLRLVFKIN